jgi:hypothetical protein
MRQCVVSAWVRHPRHTFGSWQYNVTHPAEARVIELEADLAQSRAETEAAEARADAAERERDELRKANAKLKRAVDGHPSAQIIQRALLQIERSYAVSGVGPDHDGFPSKLESYIHQIWKREPKVIAAKEVAEARIASLRALVEQWRQRGTEAAELAATFDMAGGDDAGNGHAFRKEARIWRACADRLAAALAGDPAGTVSPAPATPHEKERT